MCRFYCDMIIVYEVELTEMEKTKIESSRGERITPVLLNRYDATKSLASYTQWELGFEIKALLLLVQVFPVASVCTGAYHYSYPQLIMNNSNRWHIDCFLNRLFWPISMKTSKFCMTDPSWGESIGHRWIPSQKSQCCGKSLHYIIIFAHTYAASRDLWPNYDDVIMGAFASQITSLTIVYSTVYSDADQRKHQSSASLAFVRGIHRGPVNSPHKWPVTRKMSPFDDVIMHSVIGIILPKSYPFCWLSNVIFSKVI